MLFSFVYICQSIATEKKRLFRLENGQTKLFVIKFYHIFHVSVYDRVFL